MISLDMPSDRHSTVDLFVDVVVGTASARLQPVGPPCRRSSNEYQILPKIRYFESDPGVDAEACVSVRGACGPQEARSEAFNTNTRPPFRPRV